MNDAQIDLRLAQDLVRIYGLDPPNLVPRCDSTFIYLSRRIGPEVVGTRNIYKWGLVPESFSTTSLGLDKAPSYLGTWRYLHVETPVSLAHLVSWPPLKYLVKIDVAIPQVLGTPCWQLAGGMGQGYGSKR